MNTDPPRLRDDPEIPEGLRELMAPEVPPVLDASTKAASLAKVLAATGGAAAGAAGGAAGASAAAVTTTGVKLWWIAGGLSTLALIGGGAWVLQPDAAPPATRAVAPAEHVAPEPEVAAAIAPALPAAPIPDAPEEPALDAKC